MKRLCFILAGLWLALAGCSPQPESAQTLLYAFQDGGHYRLEATCTQTRHWIKKHLGKKFVDTTEKIHIRTSFLLRCSALPEQLEKVEFHLRNISIHDQDSRFRLELGPENGVLNWYGQEEKLEHYLGTEGLARYRSLLAHPLATMVIDARGIETTPGKTQAVKPGFNYPLIRLLGKNRVVGQVIVKSYKIPPVLMTIFPAEPIRTMGQKWVYQNSVAKSNVEWDTPLTTEFQIQQLQGKESYINLKSELRLSGTELADLGQRLGLNANASLEFKQGLFAVNGETHFNQTAGRPESGKMTIRKQYGMKTGEEDWELEEVEEHAFALRPESELSK